MPGLVPASTLSPSRSGTGHGCHRRASRQVPPANHGQKSVPGATLQFERIFEKGCVVGVIGPRVIDAGSSLLSVLISPVPVAAGYPSPAQDYFDGRIDLNEHLIKDITSTYVVRVSGDSMDAAGLATGMS